MENSNTCAKITYHNNSLLSILNQRGEKRKDIFFGIDVDELLIEMKFKVLFSTNQVRQNLMDYILKIYRSIIDENDALDLANKKKKRMENLTASVAELFNSFDNNNEDGAGGGDEKKEIFRTYIKIQKTKKVLEMTVQKEVSTSQCLVLFKEVSSYQQLKKTQTKEKFTQVLINSTAHNLFTPINGILGITQLLETQVKSNPIATKYV